MSPEEGGAGRRVRVLGAIARMNIGGPAHQVSVLYGHLDRSRYESLLLVGRPAATEGSFEHLAAEHGTRTLAFDLLSPEMRPLQDLRALGGMARILRRLRPDIINTHTAKAGFIGRAAALLALRPRPVIVHTFHGHVLEGYFGPTKSAVFRWIERLLARWTDCLVAVSEATADDLVRLGVAPRSKIAVIPLGMDLGFLAAVTPEDGTAFRRQLGVAAETPLVVSVGRLVPIKRIDVLLESVAQAVRQGFEGHVAIVGDGEERGRLEALARELGLDGRVTFTGFRTDLTAILGAADLALLTSDNEGTPVSLIEAAAAGVPALATAVGGVPEVVAPGAGVLVPRGDTGAIADSLVDLTADRACLAEMGRKARSGADRWTIEQLVDRFERLYGTLLSATRPRKGIR